MLDFSKSKTKPKFRDTSNKSYTEASLSKHVNNNGSKTKYRPTKLDSFINSSDVKFKTQDPETSTAGSQLKTRMDAVFGYKNSFGNQPKSNYLKDLKSKASSSKV